MMRIVLSQINPTIGDMQGNFALIQARIRDAVRDKADVIVFPELATVGYPPRDLLYDESLWKNHDVLIEELHLSVKLSDEPITVIVGGLHQVNLSHGRYARYNAAFIIDKDQVRVVHKRLLPCYDVFDETRYFAAAINDPYIPIPIKVRDGDKESTVSIDVLICEDIWNYGLQQSASWMSPASYEIDPVHNLRGTGPIIAINASPYWRGKIQATRDLLERIVENTNRMVLWCNQVGGHDDIVFGGYSMAVSPKPFADCDCSLQSRCNLAMAAPFCEDTLTIDSHGDINKSHGGMEMNFNGGQWNPVIRLGPVDHTADIDEPVQKHLRVEDLETYFLLSALQLGLKDYCRRTGFKKIVFGASGGIDSAVVGAIAAITLGGQNCTAITMPSRFSSDGSCKDSESLASKCGMIFKNQSIATIHDATKKVVLTEKDKFKHRVTDENLQPRIRALLLMAESNDSGSLLLTTGNKSELAVGYCTIYGDMCGGYSLLPDVPKTWVYELARFINRYWPSLNSHSGSGLIPESTITKPPSAELAPDQKDTDTLPSYESLDPIIDQILRHVPLEKVKASTDLDDSTVDRIVRMIDIAEYKRSQAPIGPKVTERAFGSGRRIPIAKKVTYV